MSGQQFIRPLRVRRRTGDAPSMNAIRCEEEEERTIEVLSQILSYLRK